MKHWNRYLLGAACLLAVCAAAASCGDAKQPAETKATETPAVTEAETTEQDVRNAIPDELPEADFGEYEFMILTQNITDYSMEDDTGDILDAAKYRRQQTVEERFNFKVATMKTASIQDDHKQFKTAALAGDQGIDLGVLHQIQVGPSLITDHCVYDWNEVPHINLTKPWWNQSINQTININDKQFYIAGYVTLPTPFAMFVNKDLMTEYDMENIYQTVRDYKWTVDKLLEYCATASKDLNGDGKFEPEVDRFGLTWNYDNTLLNFMYSCGMQSVVLDEDSYPVPCVDTEKMQLLNERMQRLAYEDNLSVFNTYEQRYTPRGTEGFKEGRFMFMTESVGYAANLRDSTVDFAVVPYPMYDEEQKAYYTHVDAWNGMLCMPICAANPERTGIIVEAYAAETYKQVMPVFYEKVLSDKYMQDEDSKEMLDVIFDGIVYDFGYIFDNWRGCTWCLVRSVQAKTSISSYYATVKKGVESGYKKLYDAIENWDEE